MPQSPEETPPRAKLGPGLRETACAPNTLVSFEGLTPDATRLLERAR